MNNAQRAAMGRLINGEDSPAGAALKRYSPTAPCSPCLPAFFNRPRAFSRAWVSSPEGLNADLGRGERRIGPHRCARPQLSLSTRFAAVERGGASGGSHGLSPAAAGEQGLAARRRADACRDRRPARAPTPGLACVPGLGLFLCGLADMRLCRRVGPPRRVSLTTCWTPCA